MTTARSKIGYLNQYTNIINQIKHLNFKRTKTNNLIINYLNIIKLIIIDEIHKNLG